MKKTILLTIAVLLGTAGLVRAQEAKELSVTQDVTYMSTFMDKGEEWYGGKSGFSSDTEIDLWGTGFGLGVRHRRANSSGFENKERLSVKAYYYNSIFKDETYKTDYKYSTTYHGFPDEPKKIGNYIEMELAVSWPDLIPGGLVPKYAVVYEYPPVSGYGYRKKVGWYHQFGLGYDLTVPELSDQVLHLSANVAYRDGLGDKPHDWSHATFGVSTGFEIAKNLTFIPGLYHQISMEDSVNEHDVTYSVFSLLYKF
jgi:hypothetical protein